MTSADRVRPLAYGFVIIGVVLAMSARYWVPGTASDLTAPTEALVTFFGVLLTSQSILFLVVDTGKSRWPSLGRMIRRSGLYFSLAFGALATVVTLFSHVAIGRDWLVVSLVLWILAVSVGGYSFITLLRFGSQGTRDRLLGQFMAGTLSVSQRKGLSLTQVQATRAVSDYLFLLEHSSTHSSGADLDSLVLQALSAKRAANTYPAYFGVELSIVRTIMRGAVNGTIYERTAERALETLLVGNGYPRGATYSRSGVHLPAVGLSWVVHYLGWFEYAVISEAEYGEISIPQLRRTVTMARRIRSAISEERATGEVGADPASAIGSALDALVYFAFVGDFGHNTAWYSQYVFYETLTGLRFNGDFYNIERPMLKELADIVYDGGAQPAGVGHNEVKGGYRAELVKLLTRGEFEAVLTRIFAGRLATMWGRVSAERAANLPPDLRTRSSSVRSILRAAGSIANLPDLPAVHDAVVRATVPTSKEWLDVEGTLRSELYEITPISSVPMHERLAPLTLVIALRIITSGDEDLAAAWLGRIDGQLLGEVADFLGELGTEFESIPRVGTAIVATLKELLHD